MKLDEKPDFPEQGMSFVQFAQSVIPGLSDRDADHVLWEYTPFPLVQGRDDLMPYLVAERDRRAALAAAPASPVSPAPDTEEADRG